MDASSIVSKELAIPKKYIKTTSRQDRVLTVVHRLWLKSLLRSHQLSDFIYHDTLNQDEVAVSLHQAEEFEPWWQKIFIRVFKKEEDEVLSLPRTRVESIRTENPLSYTHLLAYISQTNYKNLWKNVFKKHQSMYANGLSSEYESKHHLPPVDHDSVLREIILRMFGCPIISLNVNKAEIQASSRNTRAYEVHSNILPALCAIETEHYILLVQHPFISHSLQDCVTFSPAILSTSHLKPLFIIYQLLQAMRCLHDRGLVLGDITLSDVLVTDNFWIKVIPQLSRNIHSTAKSKLDDSFDINYFNKKGDQSKRSKMSKTKNCKNCFSKSSMSYRQAASFHEISASKFCVICSEANNSSEDMKIDVKTEVKNLQSENLESTDPRLNTNVSANNLEYLCELWAKGQMSNFKYLMALNQLAGRRFGDPTCHYVMPWVTDFTLRNGGNWRDLTRSKFRLNKGDRQLDLTYDTAPGSSQVPHHVSDVLSEITYYVYMARRTPQSVLCKYVRTKWVPAEYPSSIQRLQEWTPDECIPEFFTDPTVFKSVHEDLPDLEVPSWASSTQDFIEKHQEALESCYVSERLHHWIDLTFGYKLSGSAAIKSKNVCLQLVDSHTSLRNTGVVQLFIQPHPQRPGFSPYWSVLAPKIQPIRKERKKTGERSSEDEGHSSGFEEEEQGASPNLSRSSPLALSRLLIKYIPPFAVLEEKDRVDQKPSSSTVNGGSTIVLPRDYNPIAALQNVESLYGFLGRTFCHKTQSTSKHSDHHNREDHKKNVTHSRSLDMKVLGCLIVELLMASKLRAFGSHTYLSFEERLHACRSVLAYSSDSLPRYAKYAVSLLLQVDINSGFSILDSPHFPPGKLTPLNGHSYVVTDKGLPLPSAHQMLQPLLCSAVFPFPRFFSGIYTLLQKFHDYTSITRELKFLNSLDATATSKDLGSDSSIKIALFNSKVGELKVKTACEELGILLPEIQASGSYESIELILPYIKELLEDSCTSISAAWYLFDPIAKVLGPHKTCSVLLESIVKLYEYGSEDQCVTGSANKHVKLYHRSFLLQLIVRLGLKTFLENFITPLVEAVGGYREVNSTEHGFTQQQAEFRSKTSNLKTCDLEEVVPVGTLSPLDEDSSGDSENKPCNSEEDNKKPIEQDQDADLEPEVFVFESEDVGRQSPVGDSDAPLYNLMDHLDLNLPQPSGDGEDNASLELPEGTVCDEIHTPETSSKLPEDDAVKDHRDEKIKKPMGQYKVSDMSADSLLWLSHRLGPVLTSRHLSRNLLRMLTLCYLGKENLSPLSSGNSVENHDSGDILNIANGNVIGDKNAQKVLECLTSIAGLYGEQLIVLQYLPHMGELIALCKRKLTANLEGGLVGCLALLRYIIPYLSDATLMDQLQDVVLKTILNPAVRLVSTTRFIFPSGYLARAAVASKFVDAVYILALRIGCEMTRKNLAIPSLQRFFLAFDKAHGRKKNEEVSHMSRSVDSKKESPNISKSLEDYNFLEIRRDGTTAEWTVKGTPLQITHARLRDSDSADSYSPPLGMGSEGDHDQTRNRAIEELKSTFTPELAHKSYVSFLRYLGEQVMEQSLKNEDFIKDLCFEYEQERQQSTSGGPINLQYLSDYLTPTCHADFDRGSGSFGSNVSVVGNRIDLQRVDVPSVIPPSSSEEFMALISRKMENTKRHLRGNWLAYWEHEIGRAEKDTRFNFKQIKLQTFSGHSNSVRMIQALDNENSFISGSRDKTVKLWSLRSEGDGNSVSHCQWTYTGHRKSVMAISFLESLRLAASCDSVVHLWDPFIGGVLGQLDSSRSPPINVLKAMPPPSTCLLASTTDATLRIIDGRTCSFINELKVSMNPAGLIRCIAVGPEGHWVAVGQSSGTLTILDIRTGLIMSSWKGHEGEVGPAEPVHCLNCYHSELISGTTASRIGVHTAIDAEASFSSTRLRSDTFKGVLTSMAVLPLNRLLLLGSDNGNISLLC
ncbi:Neurobeachin [Gryllus bimaculatus]|nr:Neurobeachin [Gryllus bimaculatus]